MIRASPSVRRRPGSATEEDRAHLRSLLPQSLGLDTLRQFVGDRDSIQLASGDEGIIRFQVTVGLWRPTID